MKQPGLLATGIIGTIAAVLCCTTPVLVVLFSAIGLSALTGYIDYAVFAAVLIFIGIVIYALVRRKPA
jgi:mercuric ion transport protein